MIVHLTGSSRGHEEDLPFLRAIIRALNENDGVLARDWVEVAFHKNRSARLSNTDIDWESIAEDTLRAITQSDVVVVETTTYRFSQGYQVALALQQKKPVLLLSREPLRGTLLGALKHQLLQKHEYKTEQEVAKIVEAFIKENTVSTKELRFNMFIDRQIYGYLRSESLETGKNKSEIIRDLIMQEMNKKRD